MRHAYQPPWIFATLALLLASSLPECLAQRQPDVNYLKRFDRAPMDSVKDFKNFERDSVKNDPGEQRTFLKFYIPSAILSEGLEPAAISGFNFNFGDDKVEMKLGTILSGKDGDLKNSLGIKLSAAAPQGTRTIFQYDKTPRDLSATLYGTKVVRQTSKFLKPDINGDGLKEKVYYAKNAQWINVTPKFSNVKRILFSDAQTYDEKYYTNFSMLVSYNWYYNSFDPKIYGKRFIATIGAGYGEFDNFNSLDDQVLRKGSIDPAGQFFTETESVNGKAGQFIRTSGILLTASIFKPVSKADALTNITLGANINSCGLGESSSQLTGNAGIYISKRSYDNAELELKEDFSLGIIGDFSQVDSIGEERYMRNNFKIMLSAQIPMRFN